MNSLQLRNIASDDLDGIVDLFLSCFNAPPWNDGWTREAARERIADLLAQRLFRGAVALEDSRIIGAALGQKERWVHAHHYNLVEMCVAPDRQRSGIGSALFGQLLAELGREGVEKVFLLTAPTGPAAAFYAKFGFSASRGRVVLMSPKLTV